MTGAHKLHRSARRQRFWGFAGLLCLLFAALPERTTVWFVLSAAAHETGHIALMRLYGTPVCGISARAGGAVLRWDVTAVSYRQEFVCAAAGSAVNILLAVGLRQYDAAFAVNILLAVYNLLPLRGNDGAVMLGAVLSHIGGADVAKRVMRILGDVLLAVLLMLGAWLF